MSANNSTLLSAIHAAVNGNDRAPQHQTENSEMRNQPLSQADREIDDDRAVDQALQADKTPEQRIETWRARFRSSMPIQREFRREAAYVAFMEGLATGQVRICKPGR